MVTGGVEREGLVEYESTLRDGCGLLKSCRETGGIVSVPAMGQGMIDN